MLLFMIVGAGAVISPSTFQGDDGNMVAPAGTKDWANAPNLNVFTDASGNTDDSITGGANGGKEDVPYPFLTIGSVPPKTDLTTIGISTEKVSGSDFLYAASIRKAPNGSANLNFELNKGTGTPKISPNGVTPTRVAGDRLITFDFTSGGTKAEITLLTWRESGGGCYDPQAVNPCWGDAEDLDAVGYAEGAANDGAGGRTGAIAANLNSLSSEALSANQFQEMAINLTASNILPAGRCETFAYVTTKSRSSGSSFLSSLKDIHVANRPITNCGSMEITKVDDATPANPLSGATFKLYVDDGDAVFDSGDVAAVDQDGNALECTTTATGKCTVSNIFFGNYWLDETVVPTGHSKPSDLPRKVTISGTTTLQLGPFVNPRARGSIVVQKVDESNPPNPLAGAAFAIDADGDLSTTNDRTPIPAAGSTGRFCIDNLVFGTYKVVETQVPAGYTGAAAQNHTISAASTCAERTTGQDLTFVNQPVPGTINVVKEDDAGNRLNGVVFTLYEDAAPIGGSKGVEDTVVQGSCTTAGTGADTGKCSILSVPLGDYWLDESSIPAAYDKDATFPRHVTVGLGTASNTGQTQTFTATNPRKHKVIVLVCHEGTNTLAPSAVKLNGADEKESKSGQGLTAQQQADLCGLSGASYGGLGHGKNDLEVDVGSAAHN